MSPRSWCFRLNDILQASQKIVSHTQDMDYRQFCPNDRHVDAVLHNLTAVGEVSRSIPDEIKIRYPHVAWDEMRDMRNVVIHEYFGVDLSVVWQTVQEDLPKLIKQVKEILDESDPSS